MNWMLMPLRRYADFSGRSCRKEYWMFAILQAVLALTVALIYAAIAGIAGEPLGYVFLGLFAVVFLAVIIPSIAVQVRRYHDQDLSGWFVLLSFIPYAGGVISLIFMCRKGTVGDNRFGPDPLGSAPDFANIFN